MPAELSEVAENRGPGDTSSPPGTAAYPEEKRAWK